MSDAIRTLTPFNPTTGQPAEPLNCSTAAEVDAAVAAARAAAPGWENLGFEMRAQAVARVADAFEDPTTQLALARSAAAEMGKPLAVAQTEIKIAANRTRSYIEQARRACQGTTGEEGAIRVHTQWRPVGVAAVVSPWNFPVSTPNTLVVSALLTGNTVVLKPSEIVPRTGAMYAELLQGVLPQGVLGLVQGDGEVGRALVAADVNLVCFTGSIATGQAIMRSAADGMKRLVLELGGKDPMLVLPGADLDAAVTHAVRTSLANSGQVCVAVERIIVHKDLHDEFVAKAAEQVKGYKVGDPLAEGTQLGPMASEAQRALVLEQIADAKAAGADLVVEGHAKNPGWFLSPSVIAGITPQMRIATEETFGPVVAIERAESTEEALALANATHYGLGGSVWGADGPELDAIADRLECGMVGVNRGLSAAAGAPWVGWKMSGFGYSRSLDGMRQFMIPKTRAHTIAG